ncbi:MAG: rRNA adenine N-6-methyltransferase family protein [Pseudonocardia sp.]
MSDDDYRALADPQQEQYFLVAPDKLAIISEAAAIRSTDRVIELGAGVGTVARSLPPCGSLTVVELDSRLIEELRRNVPHATVINGDGVRLLREGSLAVDVVIANLPTAVTQSLIRILPKVSFRAAVLAVGSIDAFESVADKLEHSYLATISGSDFIPPQPMKSFLMRTEPRNQGTS